MQTLRSLGKILGLFESRPPQSAGGDGLVGKLMEVLIALRAEKHARTKQYALSDMVRDQLTGGGHQRSKDRQDGTIWRRNE